MNKVLQMVEVMNDDQLKEAVRLLLSHPQLQRRWPGFGLEPVQRFFLVYRNPEMSAELQQSLRSAISNIVTELSERGYATLTDNLGLLLCVGEVVEALEMKNLLQPIRTLVTLTAGMVYRGLRVDLQLSHVVYVLKAV